MNENQIENKINQWYDIVEQSITNNIPIKTTQITHKPITAHN